MTGGATFAEVLEQELAAFAPQGPVAVPAPPPLSYQAPHPLLFSQRMPPFNRPAYNTLSSCETPRVAPLETPLQPFVKQAEPPRPSRVLTMTQQRALAALIELGADLRGDFGARELRSVYRTLARRYHPDRHPSCNRAEKVRLARLFAQLNEHHRLLQTLFAESSTH